MKFVRLLTGRRAKFAVLAGWALLAAIALPIALKLSGVLNNDQLGALPTSAEASVAKARAAAAFPGPNGLVAVVVYAHDGGLTAADRAKVDADRLALRPYAQNGEVAAPTESEDRAAMLLQFPVVDDDAAVERIRDRLSSNTPDGLRVVLTGSAGADDDLFDAFAGMDIALLVTTVVAVGLILIVTYRSPVLWLLPLLSVGIASQVAAAAVYLLARFAGLTVDFQSQNVLTVLVFGVGVDYALLLISRYREELRRHRDRHRAMGVALRRSLPAIGASAGTVGLALLCLLAADLPATRGLGPVLAVGVAATFAVMTTLLPALVLLFGRWVFWPFIPRVGTAEPHRAWRGIATRVGASPRLIWLATATFLLALTAGIAHLSVGLPGDKAYKTEVGSVTGQHLIEAHFAGGTAEPVVILAAAGSVEPVRAAARGTAGVVDVRPAQISADGRWARVEAVLADDAESAASVSTVERLRDAVHGVPGADAVVGGAPAVVADTRATAARDDRTAVPLILAVVLLVLIVLLRALVAPVVLLAGVVLSYAAALGVAGLVLSAIGYSGLWEAIPLQTFVFLVALGVDYTIFLMTRTREEVVRTDHRTGVLTALTVTGGVITSAGIVLAATFAALSVLPLVASMQMALIVVAGILIDTLLVRTLLIPALVLHLGPRTWWPGRLAATSVPATGSTAPAVQCETAKADRDS